MLYKKNLTPGLDPEVFRAPGSEYRATPFWAWNAKLEEEELVRQIGIMQEMGFGGFHMHSRAGMGTKYLGEEFMRLVRVCTDEARERNMLSWLYDEDRWPSGFAGGYVTKNPAYRAKYILFTTEKNEAAVEAAQGHAEGLPYLLAVYDVCLDGEGRLISYRRIEEGGCASGDRWYVYACARTPSGRYNGQAYVDTLSAEAMREFIEITYEAYKRAVGDEFGGVVPAIFTDEPQFDRKEATDFGLDRRETKLPWTVDLADSYRETYGEELLDFLPELRWERADGALSRVRYRYHDHVCERFTRAFADQCGAWCDVNGIALTGHMMEEPTLDNQTCALGEAMRGYRGMALPGIDMLCNRKEYSTAKQAQSAVHQYGREGMLSELYGVTGWEFDFRGHKFQGDWQAALGVSIRVPHLTWLTMKGSAKRDYPASINYQAPWYKEYKLIEDHFARVNAVMTRGKPIVRVGVIHPIESYWTVYGPRDATSRVRADMEDNFRAVIERLLFGTVDFDFISESLLPSQYRAGADAALRVGEMSYDAVVVPELRTMRATTLRILSDFAARGGKLIFLGDAPRYIDAEPSDAALELYGSSIRVASASSKLLSVLDGEREVSILNSNGAASNDYIYQLRSEGDERYLFVARGREESNKDAAPVRRMIVRIKGKWQVSLLDTSDGTEKPIDYTVRGALTEVSRTLGFSDSLLLRLSPLGESVGECDGRVETAKPSCSRVIDFKQGVEYRREEDNVAMLDIAEWSMDGIDFEPAEEILRIDLAIRRRFGYPKADGQDAQPWVIPETPTEHFPTVRFRFFSEIETPLRLAYEELCEIDFNGEKVALAPDGYYVDRSIKTTRLPACRIGENILTLRVPIAPRISIEPFYLLGDFDVSLDGTAQLLRAPSKRIGFGSVTSQGMPFYGGNVIYRTEFELSDPSDIEVRVSQYRGALMRLYIDGRDAGELIYSPYTKRIEGLSAGAHTLEIKLYGNRRNTFGSLHNCDPGLTWIGPSAWYPRDERFCYDYRLLDMGVMTSPVISVFCK